MEMHVHAHHTCTCTCVYMYMYMMCVSIHSQPLFKMEREVSIISRERDLLSWNVRLLLYIHVHTPHTTPVYIHWARNEDQNATCIYIPPGSD